MDNLASHIRKFLNSRLTLAVVVIVLFRFLVLIAALYDFPHTFVPGSGKLWESGDQLDYFESSVALLHGNFLPDAFPIGYAVTLAPIIYFLQASSVYDIGVYVMVINSVFFYTLATMLVFILSRKFLSRKASIFLAACFNLYPYFFYAFFAAFSNGGPVIIDFMVTRFKQLAFMTLLSDPFSTVLVLSSLVLMYRMIEGSGHNEKTEGLWLGLLTSWAVVTRLQNLVLLPFFAAVLFFNRKNKKTFVSKNLKYFILGNIPFALLQLYANIVGNHAILGTVYHLPKYAPTGEIAPFASLAYPFRLITYPLEYSPLLFIPMAFVVALIILGVQSLVRLHKKGAILFFLFLIINTVPLLFLEYSLRNPRYFLPVVPVLLIFGYAGLIYAWGKIHPFKEKYLRKN